jgi:hypothetical protein
MADHTSQCIPLWLDSCLPYPAVDIFDPIRFVGWFSFQVEWKFGALDESVLVVMSITPCLRFVKRKCAFESADVPRDS